MNIAYFLPQPYPYAVGGMEIYSHELLKELSKNHTIHLFTTRFVYELHKYNVNQHLIFSRLFFLRQLFGLGNLSIIISATIKLLIHRRKYRVLIIPCTSTVGFYGNFFPFLKKMTKIPYILHLHGGGMQPWGKNPKYKKLINHASKTFAVSETISHEYTKRSNTPISVLLPLMPFHCATESRSEIRLRHGLNINDTVMLYVGSLKPLKGVETIIKALQLLPEDFIKCHNLHVFIVGDGPLKSQLEEICEKNKLHNHIHFKGFQPREIVPEYYKMSDLFVMASWFEGTPLALLEAMSNQLTIIASNVSGINSIITHRENGYLFDVNKPNELKTTIEFAINNNEISQQLSSNANNHFNKNYNYNNYIESITSILTELTDDSGYKNN